MLSLFRAPGSLQHAWTSFGFKHEASLFNYQKQKYSRDQETVLYLSEGGGWLNCDLNFFVNFDHP